MTTTLETILPKVKQVAFSFSNGDPCRGDDIFSQACLYIVGRGFENEKPSFILQQVVWQAISNYDRSIDYTKYVQSLETVIEMSHPTDDDGVEMPWTEVLPDCSMSVEDQIIQRQQAKALSEAVEALDPKAQQIIRLLREGRNFAQISEMMGVSRSAVSQRLNTIQKYLTSAIL